MRKGNPELLTGTSGRDQPAFSGAPTHAALMGAQEPCMYMIRTSVPVVVENAHVARVERDA